MLYEFCLNLFIFLGNLKVSLISLCAPRLICKEAKEV